MSISNNFWGHSLVKQHQNMTVVLSPLFFNISYSILQIPQSFWRVLSSWKKEDSKITVGPEQVQKTCKDIKNDPWSYLHSFRIRSPGLLVIFLGKSIFSIPFRMNVYIIIWSEPVKGGLQEQSDQICFNTQNKSSTRICIKKCLPQHRVYDKNMKT